MQYILEIKICIALNFPHFLAIDQYGAVQPSARPKRIIILKKVMQKSFVSLFLILKWFLMYFWPLNSIPNSKPEKQVKFLEVLFNIFLTYKHDFRSIVDVKTFASLSLTKNRRGRHGTAHHIVCVWRLRVPVT